METVGLFTDGLWWARSGVVFVKAEFQVCCSGLGRRPFDLSQFKG